MINNFLLNATGGTVTSSSPSSILIISPNEIIGLILNGGPVSAGNFGTISMITSIPTQGDLVGGAILAGGGTISIIIPGNAVNFVSNMSPGSVWLAIKLANGNILYQLSGSFSSTAGYGRFLFQTVVPSVWPGSVAIATLSINLTVNAQIAASLATGVFLNEPYINVNGNIPRVHTPQSSGQCQWDPGQNSIPGPINGTYVGQSLSATQAYWLSQAGKIV